jgi:hypothetical protein
MPKENKRAPANSPEQPSIPANRTETWSMDDIAKKVVDELTPVLTSAIRAAVQEMVSEHPPTTSQRPIVTESKDEKQGKHLCQTLRDNILIRITNRRAPAYFSPHRHDRLC